MRFSFLFLFDQKEANGIILRFCQFKGLHNLKTSLSESRVATFGDVTIPALKLSGLVWRCIIACIGVKCLPAMKAADISYFRKDNRSETVPNPCHGTKNFIFRQPMN